MQAETPNMTTVEVSSLSCPQCGKLAETALTAQPISMQSLMQNPSFTQFNAVLSQSKVWQTPVNCECGARYMLGVNLQRL